LPREILTIYPSFSVLSLYIGFQQQMNDRSLSSMHEPAFDFDVDHYIDRFVPRPRLYLLPTPISWILGYRSKPMPRIGSVVVWFWAFIGAFAGILVVEAVFHTKGIEDLGAPTVIASLV
jgi:hypothetical protein